MAGGSDSGGRAPGKRSRDIRGGDRPCQGPRPPSRSSERWSSRWRCRSRSWSRWSMAERWSARVPPTPRRDRSRDPIRVGHRRPGGPRCQTGPDPRAGRTGRPVPAAAGSVRRPLVAPGELLGGRAAPAEVPLPRHPPAASAWSAPRSSRGVYGAVPTLRITAQGPRNPFRPMAQLKAHRPNVQVRSREITLSNEST